MKEKVLTKYGVCYDLEKSPFVYMMKNINLHFSSQSHLDKFTQKRDQHIHSFAILVSSKLKIPKDCVRCTSEIALLSLYKQIETRGFYISDQKGNQVPLNNLFYNIYLSTE